MTILDRLFIGLFSLGLLSFLLTFFFSIQFFGTHRRLQQVQNTRTKNKKRRLRLKREKQHLTKVRKRWLLAAAVFLFVGVGSTSGAFYARYYQQTNLTKEDAYAIVQSYFLSEEIQENLETLSNGGSVETILPKLREISALLVSYGNHPLAPGMSEEGTKMLVRYMSQMREIGTNLHDATSDQLNDAEVLAGYQQDLEKMIQQRQKVFDYFSINEAAMKSSK